MKADYNGLDYSLLLLSNKFTWNTISVGKSKEYT